MGRGGVKGGGSEAGRACSPAHVENMTGSDHGLLLRQPAAPVGWSESPAGAVIRCDRPRIRHRPRDPLLPAEVQQQQSRLMAVTPHVNQAAPSRGERHARKGSARAAENGVDPDNGGSARLALFSGALFHLLFRAVHLLHLHLNLGFLVRLLQLLVVALIVRATCATAINTVAMATATGVAGRLLTVLVHIHFLFGLLPLNGTVPAPATIDVAVGGHAARLPLPPPPPPAHCLPAGATGAACWPPPPPLPPSGLCPPAAAGWPQPPRPPAGWSPSRRGHRRRVLVAGR